MKKAITHSAVNAYSYLSGYKPNRDKMFEEIIADFEAQAKKLDSLFNVGVGFNKDWLRYAYAVCPSWVEKFFAEVPWQKVASSYGEAVSKLLEILKQTRDSMFYNYHEGQFVTKQFRQSRKSATLSQRLSDQQRGKDVLVVPAQFGIRHRGRSACRARKVMKANECGLGVFSIAVMLLIHPERLMCYDDLWIDGVGDEFRSDDESGFSECPYFRFYGDRIGLDIHEVLYAYDYCGSVSLYLPKR